jgi:hypothetical protein
MSDIHALSSAKPSSLAAKSQNAVEKRHEASGAYKEINARNAQERGL